MAALRRGMAKIKHQAKHQSAASSWHIAHLCDVA